MRKRFKEKEAESKADKKELAIVKDNTLSVDEQRITELMHSLSMVSGVLVPKCTESCPIYDQCEFVGNTCTVKKNYMEMVKGTLELALTERTDIDLLKINMMLMPLFSQLLTFSLYTQGSGCEVLFGSRINPVFRETRMIIKDIIALLTDLGCKKRFEGFGGSGSLDGDGDYYEELLKQAHARS